MKISVTLLVILLMTSFSIAQAEPSAKKKKESTTSAKNKKGKQPLTFTDATIDMSLEKLPPNYYGNNPRIIYDIFTKRKKSAVKGEFETTENFMTRIEKEKKFPIIGQILQNGHFAFRGEKPDTEYIADTSELRIKIKLGRVSEPVAHIYNKSYKTDYTYVENAKAISLEKSSKAGSDSYSYTAQNRFGALVDVTSHNIDLCDVAVINYKDFPVKEIIKKEALKRAEETEASYKKYGMINTLNNNFQDYDKEWSIDTKIKVDTCEARNVKENIRFILIASIEEPFVYADTSVSAATYDRPSSILVTYRYLTANLKEVWIYNAITGHIYTKIKRQNVN